MREEDSENAHEITSNEIKNFEKRNNRRHFHKNYVNLGSRSGSQSRKNKPRKMPYYHENRTAITKTKTSTSFGRYQFAQYTKIGVMNNIAKVRKHMKSKHPNVFLRKILEAAELLKEE